MSKKYLFILPRRGLFTTTVCKNCGHVFVSEESDTTLLTVKFGATKLLLDPTTQQTFAYPSCCPNCKSTEIESMFSGVDDLKEKLCQYLTPNITTIYPTSKSTNSSMPEDSTPVLSLYKQWKGEITIDTRYFNPLLDYTVYNAIIIIQAEGVLRSIDYLASEELYRDITRLYYSLSEEQQLIVDTSDTNHPLIHYLHTLQSQGVTTYYTMLQKELTTRDKVYLPPNYHVILLTSHHSSQNTAFHNARNTVEAIHQSQLVEPNYIFGPYPAKMLRRKNKYSYHVRLHIAKENPVFPQLKKFLLDFAKRSQIQVRLNPKHIF